MDRIMLSAAVKLVQLSPTKADKKFHNTIESAKNGK
jgi:hypothetical protein